MAVFNPQIPQNNPPDYLRSSRYIEPSPVIHRQGQQSLSILPEGAKYQGPVYEGNKHEDTSGLYAGRAQGMEYAGLGDLVHGAASLAALAGKEAVETVKSHIDEAEIPKVEALQQSRMDELSMIDASVHGADVSALIPGAPGTAESAPMAYADASSPGSQVPGVQRLFMQAPDGTEAKPPEIEDFPAQAENLAAARANGKISNTYYYQRLNTLAKQLRDRYPGFRDYIDSRISNITGVNPANAYIRSVLGDINSFIAASGSKKDLAESTFKEALKFPNGAKMIQAVQQGKLDKNQYLEWYNSNASQDFRYKAEDQADQRANRDQKNDANVAEQRVTDRTMTAIGNTMKSFVFDLGGDPSNPQQLNDYVQGVMNGTIKPEPVAMQTAGNALQRAATKAYAEVNQMLDAPMPDGRTLRMRMGPEKAKQSVDNMFATTFKPLIDGFTNKDVGAIHAAYNGVQARLNGAQSNLIFSGMPIADSAANYGAIQKLFPGAGGAVLSAGIAAKLPQEYQTYLEEQSRKVIVQPNPGNPTTLNDLWDDATRKQLHLNGDEGKRLMQGILDLPKIIADPKVDDGAKKNVLTGLIDPKNYGIVDKIKQDTDKYKVIREWTDPNIVKEAYRLGVGKEYTQFIGNEFATVFRSEVSNLSSMQATGQFIWNDKVTPPQFDSTTNHRGMQTAADRAMNRLNGGIRSLYSAQGNQLTNEQFSAAVMQLFMQMGYKPEARPTKESAVQGVKSVADSLWMAVKSAFKPIEEPKPSKE